MARTSVVVGGVAHLFQGDLDAGRIAIERLGDLGDGVVVEEFSYGAVAVAQRLEELAPELLVLVGAKRRGREPGTVEVREVELPPVDPAVAQGSIADAVTGYIDLDLVVDVAHALGALPARTVVVEIEPENIEASETLSPTVEAALAEAVERVRQSVSSNPRL